MSKKTLKIAGIFFGLAAIIFIVSNHSNSSHTKATAASIQESLSYISHKDSSESDFEIKKEKAKAAEEERLSKYKIIEDDKVALNGTIEPEENEMIAANIDNEPSGDSALNSTHATASNKKTTSKKNSSSFSSNKSATNNNSGEISEVLSNIDQQSLANTIVGVETAKANVKVAKTQIVTNAGVHIIDTAIKSKSTSTRNTINSTISKVEKLNSNIDKLTKELEKLGK